MLTRLVSASQAILHNNLVGIYLRGSLATGGFDHATSDIDFLTVTEQRVSDAEFADLAARHAAWGNAVNRYGQQLEGCYIERQAVYRFHPGESYPTIGRQETLIWSQHDYHWVIERWVVREQGVTLWGPAPQSLIAPIGNDELREAVRLRISSWAAWVQQPEDADWCLPRSHKAYVIDTMCRALYTTQFGTLVSKPDARTWALTALPAPWRFLVEQARLWHTDATLDLSVNQAIQDFILWTASEIDKHDTAS